MRFVNAREALDQALDIRLAMLREVVHLPDGVALPEDLARSTAEYLTSGDQTTLLAMEGDRPVACATLCYLTLLPSFTHPTGRRAHLMNVYTAPEHRRKGLARQLAEALLAEARQRGVTEIRLDATQVGRPLYEALGFSANEEGMTIAL